MRYWFASFDAQKLTCVAFHYFEEIVTIKRLTEESHRAQLGNLSRILTG